jgi:small nuclear ribonucleoprotein D3
MRCRFALQVELKSGEIYRGELHEAEDNWNVQLTNVQATARDGKVTHMEHLFVRGSRVRFVIVPDMLKNAPMVSMAAVGCCMRCR